MCARYPLSFAQSAHFLCAQPEDVQAGLLPDSTTDTWLFDRVVNIRRGYSVPLGLRGTIIGVKKSDRRIDSLYEVLFDKPFDGGFHVR